MIVWGLVLFFSLSTLTSISLCLFSINSDDDMRVACYSFVGCEKPMTGTASDLVIKNSAQAQNQPYYWLQTQKHHALSLLLSQLHPNFCPWKISANRTRPVPLRWWIYVGDEAPRKICKQRNGQSSYLWQILQPFPALWCAQKKILSNFIQKHVWNPNEQNICKAS